MMTGSADHRIARVAASGFRGIPHPLSLSFVDRDGQPASAIVFGDNGSGKSSIADAIEFACQSRVSGRMSLRAGQRPFALSFAGAESARTEVFFADATSVARAVERREDGELRRSADGVHESFRVVPMVVRRSDVLAFLDQSPEQRGKILEAYALDAAPRQSSGAPAASEGSDRLALKRRRRELLAAISERLGLTGDQPRTAAQLLPRLAARGYRGYSLRPGASALPADVATWVTSLQTTEAALQQIRGDQANVGTVLARRVAALEQILEGVSQFVTSIFLHVSTAADFVSKVEFVAGRLTQISIEARVVLKTNHVCEPQQLFSEGSQDVIALLFYLALAIEGHKRGQAPVLVLDDVFQSVDAGVRVRVIDAILPRLTAFQLIFTVHDRLWREQLRSLLRQHGVRFIEHELRTWRFDVGPTILHGRGALDHLAAARETGSPVAIAALAGRQLEALCDSLSWSLPVSVQRRREDKYTLADTWNGVASKLRKSSAAAAVEEVARWDVLRNVAGAHHNEWATALSLGEAVAFSEAVEQLSRVTMCVGCEQPVSARDGKPPWACRCGQTRVEAAPAGAKSDG